jgi:hypothetical protein
MTRLLPSMHKLAAAAVFCAFAAPVSAATDCAAVAAQRQRLNLSSGVYTEQAVVSAPLAIELPAGTDAAVLAECLKLEGIDPAAEMAAEIVRAGDCERSTRQVRLTPAAPGSAPRIASERDDARYQECLAGEIAVEVLPAGSP